jgi:5-methylcytosine-specific restriction endonuclease McrA
MTSGSYIKTPEHRKKLSASRMGKKFSASHRLALSISHLGKTFKHTNETKEKIRLSNLGKKRSEETKAKLKLARARQPKHGVSIEARLRMSNERKGDQWYTWKGGITPKHIAIRNTVEYKLWRESVFKRDDFTCIFCKIKGGTLNADHIKPFCNYPELRFEINNGRTLCVGCHKKTETYGPNAKNK